MRIRTQLLLAAAAAGVVTVLVLASFLVVTQRSAASLRGERDSQDVARSVANLLALTQEYTLYGSERADEQWRACHAQLAATIAGALAREPVSHPALLEIQQRVRDIRPLYEQLESVVRQDTSALAPRRRELLIERLVSEAQELVEARHRWATSIIERQARDQRTSGLIAFAAGAALLAMIVALIALVARRGLRPLVRLQAAAAAIERGDLHVRCDTHTQDELADTGRAVNAMAESLLSANAALSASQERYRLVVDGANQGLWDWNLEDDLLYVSARAQGLLGLDAGEPCRARADWDSQLRLHPDDAERVNRAVAGYLRGNDAHLELECRLPHRDGNWRWYRLRAVAVRNEAGQATRMAGSMEDISARKAAEAERDRLELQLRQAQKLEAIGTLAGGIAHDFNNILSAILGYGEMVRSEAAEGTRLRRNIDAAMNASQRAKSLVERILAFSRAGLGERTAVPVRAVVSEALDTLQAALPARVQLARQLDGVGDGDGVLGDAVQLHQVVMNLGTNAAQAMTDAGTLTVRLELARLETPLTVATNTLPPGPYIRLAVTDTGEGVEPQVLDRLFDPFFTTKEVGVGTGLGLSLVHGIVGDLGGGIAVDSLVGQGSTFTVYLPWQLCERRAPEADEPLPPGCGETILVVDDEPALVGLCEEMLADLGYEPVGFGIAARALEAFRARPDRFDAVLTDEAMPGLSGTDLGAELRRLRPELPMVLMSGFANAALYAKASAVGFSHVLAKPLGARDIARTLADVFGRACAREDGAHPPHDHPDRSAP